MRFLSPPQETDLLSKELYCTSLLYFLFSPSFPHLFLRFSSCPSFRWSNRERPHLTLRFLTTVKKDMKWGEYTCAPLLDTLFSQSILSVSCSFFFPSNLELLDRKCFTWLSISLCVLCILLLLCLSLHESHPSFSLLLPQSLQSPQLSLINRIFLSHSSDSFFFDRRNRKREGEQSCNLSLERKVVYKTYQSQIKVQMTAFGLLCSSFLSRLFILPSLYTFKYFLLISHMNLRASLQTNFLNFSWLLFGC